MKEPVHLRVGNWLLIEGKIYKVTEVEVKGAAKVHKTVNLKMCSILDQKHIDHTYHQEDKFEEAEVLHKKAIYSYKDDDTFYFIDDESYDNYAVNKNIIGHKEAFLKENEKYIVEVYENTPIDVIFQERIQLKVITSPPGIKQHDSVTPKPITLENGMEIDVPQFIEEGDIVEIDSHTGKYIDRLKK